MSKIENSQSCPTASIQEPESWPQPQAEPQVGDEEDEIKALLWPFVNDKGSETLQEIQALSVNLMHNQDREGMDPMPNNQLLQPPSQVLQISAANQLEEEQNMEQERGGDNSNQREEEQNLEQERGVDNSNQLEEEQNMEQESAGDDSNQLEEEQNMEQERRGHNLEMSSGASKQKKTKSGGAKKKPMKKRDVDDDSWMPEGWVKRVNQRPFKGKFPGYNDKKYYAPGVARAFR